MDVGYGLLNVALYVSSKVVLYFSCLYGRWKCYGNFHPKTRLIFFIIKINGKINSLGGAKIPYFVYK